MSIRALALAALIIIALIMIYLGYSNGILPPTLTGVGFIIIAALLGKKGR